MLGESSNFRRTFWVMFTEASYGQVTYLIAAAELYPDGSVCYDGDFANNLYEGNGVETTEDGVYTGAFVNGVKHGHGELLLKDKSTYIGWFENDKCHGDGITTGPTGLVMNNDGLLLRQRNGCADGRDTGTVDGTLDRTPLGWLLGTADGCRKG
eukprot:gene35174-43361_t